MTSAISTPKPISIGKDASGPLAVSSWPLRNGGTNVAVSFDNRTFAPGEGAIAVLVRAGDTRDSAAAILTPTTASRYEGDFSVPSQDLTVSATAYSGVDAARKAVLKLTNGDRVQFVFFPAG